VLAAVLAIGWLVCGGYGCGDSDEGGIVCSECGPMGSPDAGVQSPTPGDSSPPLFANGAGASFGRERETDSADPEATYDPESCYDGVDGDGDSLIDCADGDCAGLRSCAIGNSDRCPVLTESEHDFSVCDDTLAPEDCVTADPFGPARWIADGMLVPGGSTSEDAGLLLEAIDTTVERVVLDITLRTDGCRENCVEGAGVGMVAGTTLDGASVQPAVALVLSSSRATVSLVVGDRIEASWPVEPGVLHAYELALSPAGLATVSANGTEQGSAQFEPVAGRVVVFGRNTNIAPGSAGGARIGRIGIERSLCDIPTAWRDRGQLEIRDRTTRAPIVDALEAPSIAVDTEGNAALAFQMGSRVLFAMRGEPSVPNTFSLAHTLGESALEQHDPYAAFAVRDPELFYQGDTWHLLYTAVGTDGVMRIGHAVRSATALPTGLRAFEPDPRPLLDPADHSGERHFEMPTLAILPWGPRVLIVRATSDDGATRLLAFVSREEGALWEPFVGGRLEELTARGPGPAITSRFDADEIAHPSLVVHGGAFQLFYAGRRGTRWGVGLLASDELAFWRTVSDDEPVLGPLAGPERIGVDGIDVVARGDTIEIVYRGLPGTGSRLGHAARRSAETP
jgi:hypothetical protein